MTQALVHPRGDRADPSPQPGHTFELSGEDQARIARLMRLQAEPEAVAAVHRDNAVHRSAVQTREDQAAALKDVCA